MSAATIFQQRDVRATFQGTRLAVAVQTHPGNGKEQRDSEVSFDLSGTLQGAVEVKFEEKSQRERAGNAAKKEHGLRFQHFHVVAEGRGWDLDYAYVRDVPSA